LSEQGADVTAMGVDAANAIQAGNSLEKMLAHQLAAAHKAAMEMIGSVYPNSHDASAHTKRLNAAARCMHAYQQIIDVTEAATERKSTHHGSVRQCE
jgi:hypothetical protein